MARVAGLEHLDRGDRRCVVGERDAEDPRGHAAVLHRHERVAVAREPVDAAQLGAAGRGQQPPRRMLDVDRREAALHDRDHQRATVGGAGDAVGVAGCVAEPRCQRVATGRQAHQARVAGGRDHAAVAVDLEIVEAARDGGCGREGRRRAGVEVEAHEPGLAAPRRIVAHRRRPFARRGEAVHRPQRAPGGVDLEPQHRAQRRVVAERAQGAVGLARDDPPLPQAADEDRAACRIPRDALGEQVAIGQLERDAAGRGGARAGQRQREQGGSGARATRTGKGSTDTAVDRGLD
ncbi:MAG: hypothetical protein U0168_10920 [Nannocystaceae bacterium]